MTNIAHWSSNIDLCQRILIGNSKRRLRPIFTKSCYKGKYYHRSWYCHRRWYIGRDEDQYINFDDNINFGDNIFLYFTNMIKAIFVMLHISVEIISTPIARKQSRYCILLPITERHQHRTNTWTKLLTASWTHAHDGVAQTRQGDRLGPGCLWGPEMTN